MKHEDAIYYIEPKKQIFKVVKESLNKYNDELTPHYIEVEGDENTNFLYPGTAMSAFKKVNPDEKNSITDYTKVIDDLNDLKNILKSEDLKVAEYKKADYHIKSNELNLEVIEEKINNYKTGPEIIAYKVKTKKGEMWITKEYFDLFFQKEEEEENCLF